MAKTTRDLSGTIMVGGEAFDWWLDREPQWCNTGWQGMAIGVRHSEGKREALMQFPVPKGVAAGSSQLRRQQVNDAIVKNCIEAAIAAGWEPLSRGRPEVFEVDSQGR